MTCRVLHETAAAETEIYGEIMSGSVAEHMKSCNINYLGIKHEPPTVPNNCLHEYSFVERTMCGDAYYICEFCGTSKLVLANQVFNKKE